VLHAEKSTAAGILYEDVVNHEGHLRAPRGGNAQTRNHGGGSRPLAVEGNERLAALSMGSLHTHLIGIRMALGAQPCDLLDSMLLQGDNLGAKP
jgi:hypothetical protein